MAFSVDLGGTTRQTQIIQMGQKRAFQGAPGLVADEINRAVIYGATQRKVHNGTKRHMRKKKRNTPRKIKALSR